MIAVGKIIPNERQAVVGSMIEERRPLAGFGDTAVSAGGGVACPFWAHSDLKGVFEAFALLEGRRPGHGENLCS